jgi:hypothetical protein
LKKNSCYGFEDLTGLSDPYVKITICNQSVYSESIPQTNNPKWDTTLIIPEIFIYTTYEHVVNSPPEIILEAFDQDQFGPNEFMGKSYIRPSVHSDTDNSPKLTWYNIFYGNEEAGDILASFELIKRDRIEPLQKSMVVRNKIPLSIMPKLKPYILEVAKLF